MAFDLRVLSYLDERETGSKQQSPGFFFRDYQTGIWKIRLIRNWRTFRSIYEYYRRSKRISLKVNRSEYILRFLYSYQGEKDL